MALITTTKGEIDESLLVKSTGQDENSIETIYWTEYALDGEMVHRSVHVVLKPQEGM